jgi:TPR repeat protein
MLARLIRLSAGALAASLMVAALAGCVTTGRSEDAAAAYNRGDYATATKLYRPLAEQGDARAQHALGVMYRHGQGVPQDYAQAYKWYKLAASRLPRSNHRNGVEKSRDFIAAFLTPAQIAEVHQEVREWKPK